MPNRIIKESCRTSETLDSITAESERLFWRLVTVADDHGRFEADPRILLANCFPLKVGELTPQLVDMWFTELQAVDAIRCYYVNKKKYGTFVSWESHQRKRAEHSKFPDPVGNLPPPSYDNNCGHLSAEDSESEPVPAPEDNSGHLSADADIGGEMPPRVVFESSIREARVENETHICASEKVEEQPLSQSEPVKKKSRNDYSSGFNRFRASHPHGNESATEAWGVWKQMRLESKTEEICNALDQQKTWPELVKEGYRYFTRMPRYLRRERWKDKPPETNGGVSSQPRLHVLNNLREGNLTHGDTGRNHRLLDAAPGKLPGLAADTGDRRNPGDVQSLHPPPQRPPH